MVKASLTGSIIGNILLVLGARWSSAACATGCRRSTARMPRAPTRRCSSLAAVALLVAGGLPFVARASTGVKSQTPGREVAIERTLSLEIAIVLFVSYLLSLVFTLRTHKHLYAGAAGEHEHRPIQVGRAIVTLVVATALVAWMSELLVGAVEKTSHVLGLSEVFVGVIVVPRWAMPPSTSSP